MPWASSTEWKNLCFLHELGGFKVSEQGRGCQWVKVYHGRIVSRRYCSFCNNYSGRFEYILLNLLNYRVKNICRTALYILLKITIRNSLSGSHRNSWRSLRKTDR